MDVNRRTISTHFAKLHARRQRSVCFLSKNDNSAPAADPAVGQAAQMNAETARAQLKIGEDQLAWNKEQYADSAPIYKNIAQQQIDAADTAKVRSDDQWNQYKSVFQPIETQVADEAKNYGGESDQVSQAGKAIADTTGAFDAATGNQDRAMQASGINPADPRYAALKQQAGLERAKAASGAGTKAATDSKLLGMSMRQNVAQFGRNMPATSIAQDASALSAGNSAQGNTTGAAMAHNAGVNSAMPWYAGATDSSASAGNLGLGLYGAQSANWRTGMQADASGAAGLGQLAGTAIGAYGAYAAAAAMKDGGVVKTVKLADGGMASTARRPTGRIMDVRPGMKMVVLELPDPDIDPIEGDPLDADGTPMSSADAGLQRIVQPTKYADGTSDAGRRFIAGQEQNAADVAATWGEAKAQPAVATGGNAQTGLTRDERNARTAATNRGPTNPSMRQQMGLAPLKFSDGGLIDYADTQAPAPVDDYSTDASPSDKARLNPKRSQLQLKAQGRASTAFTADFDAFAGGGLVRRNYDGGGMVAGPGTTTSDSVPAQLSNHEAVLNAEATQIVGEDFVKRINAAGLERREQGAPAGFA